MSDDLQQRVYPEDERLRQVQADPDRRMTRDEWEREESLARQAAHKRHETVKHDREVQQEFDRKKKSQHRNWGKLLLWIGLGVAVLLVIFLIGYLPHRAHAKSAAAAARQRDQDEPQVTVLQVKRSHAPGELTVPGTTAPLTEAYIYARANGYVRKRYVDIGDHVKKGQLLAVLDAPDLDQQVEQARQQLRQAQADEAQQQAQLDLRRVTWERWRTLVAKGVFSRQDGDQRETDYRAQLAIVASSQRNVESFRANLNRAIALQSYERVTAPFDGIITQRNTDVGALVGSGGSGMPAPISTANSTGGGSSGNNSSSTGGSSGNSNQSATPSTGSSSGGALFAVAQVDKLRILVAVPEGYASSIAVGMPAKVFLQERTGKPITGTVTRATRSLDQNTRTMLTEVDLDNRNGSLYPGMYTVVSFVQVRGESPLTVPGDSIVVRQDRTMVAIVREMKVEMVPVEIGRDYGPTVEILSGLREGDQVITTVSDGVRQGAKVRPQQKKEEGEDPGSGGAQTNKVPNAGPNQYGDQSIVNQKSESTNDQGKKLAAAVLRAAAAKIVAVLRTTNPKHKKKIRAASETPCFFPSGDFPSALEPRCVGTTGETASSVYFAKDAHPPGAIFAGAAAGSPVAAAGCSAGRSAATARRQQYRSASGQAAAGAAASASSAFPGGSGGAERRNIRAWRSCSPAVHSNVFHAIAPYRVAHIPALPAGSTSRLAGLVRDGKLYLSLHDALALAIENNLDVEVGRYSLALADTDLTRARGGGNLRGLDYSVQQTAPGVGAATSPLLITATTGNASPTNASVNDLSQVTQTGSGQQSTLSLSNGDIYSPGPAIPVFDPTVVAEAGYLRRSNQTSLIETTAATGTAGTTTNTGPLNYISTGVDYQQGFSPGTQIEAFVDNAPSVLYGPESQYNPFKTPSTSFTVSQPLLRGRGRSVNLRFVRIAQLGQRVSRLVFEQQLLETIYGVSRLYYDLVSLGENIAVKEQSLAAAQRLLEDDRNQVSEGTLAPVELTRAQALVSSSRLDLIQARGEYRQQEVILRQQLVRNLADPGAQVMSVVATDRILVPDAAPVFDVAALTADALANRPDLAQAGLQVQANEIAARGTRNGVKPLLNVYANVQTRGSSLVPYQTLGSTGTGVIQPPTALTQGGLRLSTIYQAGIQLNLPLRNRIAQADAARDEVQLRRSEGRTQKLANDIRQQIENASIALENAHEAYAAAVESRNYQQQLLQAEIDKFAVGASTNFLIVQDQAYLAQARSTEVAARSNWMKAQMALDRSLGDLLQKNRIEFDDAIRGEIR